MWTFKKALVRIIFFAITIIWIMHSRIEKDTARFVSQRLQTVMVPDDKRATRSPSLLRTTLLPDDNRTTRFASSQRLQAILTQYDKSVTYIPATDMGLSKGRTTFEYYNMESSVQVPWKYDGRFKSPCWYENGTLHCLPYFFIIGGKKCGTTSMHSYLRRHPEGACGKYMEPQFFHGGLNAEVVGNRRNIYTYIGMFSDVTKKIEQDYKIRTEAGTSTSKLIFCDASTTYLNGNWKDKPGNVGLKEPKYVVLDYVQRMLPKAKMIMLLRDPIDRLYSDYYFSLHLDNEMVKRIAGPKHFHAFVEKAVKAYQRCLGSHSSRFCVYNEEPIAFRVQTRPFRYGVLLSKGVYHVFMEELLRLFPRQQILVLQTKTLATRQELTRTFNFLGMKIPDSDSEWDQITNIGQRNVRSTYYTSKGPMLNTTRKLLYEFYKPFNKRMVDITGNKEFAFEMSPPSLP